MSQNSTTSLMNLSVDTKILINQGTFSLFSIEASTSEGAEFLLCANSKNFLLDHVGAVVKETKNVQAYKITGSVKFPNIIAPVFSFGNLNIA